MSTVGQTDTQSVHSLTVLTDVDADAVDVDGEVGHGRPHGGAGGPHVVEEEDGHGGEAEHAQPRDAQDVGQEHKLVAQRNRDGTLLA